MLHTPLQYNFLILLIGVLWKEQQLQSLVGCTLEGSDHAHTPLTQKNYKVVVIRKTI